MKRYNLIQARGGEFTFGTEGLASEGEGSDVVELKIKRGTVSVVIPADLPDHRAHYEFFKRITALDIELEDGTHITGFVRGGEAQLETDSRVRRKTKLSQKPAKRKTKTKLITRQVLTRRVAHE